MSEQHAPFKTLGTHLRYLREQSSQSLAEVSGAVEIDEALLERIEGGFVRPAEDILLLLISHFGMQDQEAVQLWELAGYDGAPDTIRLTTSDDAAGNQSHKPVVMLLALDARTIYSDGCQVATNQAGVTINFTQSNAQNSAASASRIGMSYEQAYQVMRELQQALLKAKYLGGPRPLPPGDNPTPL